MIEWLRQIVNLRDNDKSRYFAQPSPIIVYCFDSVIAFFFLSANEKREKITTGNCNLFVDTYSII